MEDLVPVLIFVVVALINVIKFVTENKAGKGKKQPATPPPPPPRRGPSSIEEFFERLSEQFQPKPAELPDWPASRPRPDYVAEAEAYGQPQPAAPAPAPPPSAVPTPMEPEPPVEVAMPRQARAPTPFAGLKTPRLPSMSAPKTGGADARVELRDKAKLREAMIAKIIFSPPRAYDTTLERVPEK